jgi:MFS family permease
MTTKTVSKPSIKGQSLYVKGQSLYPGSVALLCVAQFVVVLDVTIVAVALPSIRDDLGFSEAGLQWVLSAYGLTFGGFLMLFGRVADLAGRRRVLTASFAVFGAASLACGLAPSPAALIAARAVQGAGAAAVSPAALSLLTTAVPEGAARTRALAAWTAAAAGGGALGWVLGGAITQALGWSWVFLVNVVPCAVAGALIHARLPESRGPRPLAWTSRARSPAPPRWRRQW